MLRCCHMTWCCAEPYVTMRRDELAHPIFGERQLCNALLLRLTQPNAPDSSGGAVSGSEQSTVKAEIVARVAVGYR